MCKPQAPLHVAWSTAWEQFGPGRIYMWVRWEPTAELSCLARWMNHTLAVTSQNWAKMPIKMMSGQGPLRAIASLEFCCEGLSTLRCSNEDSCRLMFWNVWRMSENWWRGIFRQCIEGCFVCRSSWNDLERIRMIRTCVGCKYIELSAHERIF